MWFLRAIDVLFFCLLQLVTEEDGSACGLAYTIWKYMIQANVSVDKVVAGIAGTAVNYVFEAGKTYAYTMSVSDIYYDLLQLQRLQIFMKKVIRLFRFFQILVIQC